MGNEHSGGWPAVSIELTAEERMTLEFLSRQRTATYQEVIRARALLKAAEGQRNRCIGHAVGVDERTVRTWRKDFVERRLDSLHDRKRPGRPRRFSPSVRAAVTHLACQKPGTVVSVPTDMLPSEEPASAAPSPVQNPTPQAVPGLGPAVGSGPLQALPGSASAPETEIAAIEASELRPRRSVQGSEADGPTVLFPPDG
jgi:transposase-like protein